MWINVLKPNTWKNLSIRGHWCIPKTVDGERTCHWWLQVSRNSNESRILFENKWSKFDGKESTRSRELRHPPLWMILRNHNYLKVYKCWWILPILKTPTMKWFAIFFKTHFNFQGFYIVYIIIWWFFRVNKFYPIKIGQKRASKNAKWQIFFGRKTWKNSPLG